MENLGAANRDNQPLRLTCAISMYDTSGNPSKDLCAGGTQGMVPLVQDYVQAIDPAAC